MNFGKIVERMFSFGLSVEILSVCKRGCTLMEHITVLFSSIITVKVNLNIIVKYESQLYRSAVVLL